MVDMISHHFRKSAIMRNFVNAMNLMYDETLNLKLDFLVPEAETLQCINHYDLCT